MYTYFRASLPSLFPVMSQWWRSRRTSLVSQENLVFFLFARSSIWKWYVLKHLFAFGSLPSKEEEKDKRNNHLFCVIHQPAAPVSSQSQPCFFCLPLDWPVFQKLYWVKWSWCSSLSRRLILSVRKDQENINKTPYYFLVTSIWVMISMPL